MFRTLILRLCRGHSVFNKNYCKNINQNNINELNSSKKTTQNDIFKEKYERYKDKIVFSSYLEAEKVELGYFNYHKKMMYNVRKMQKQEYADKSLSPIPISMQYYVDKDKLLNEKKQVSINDDLHNDKSIQLPLAESTKLEVSQNINSDLSKPSHKKRKTRRDKMVASEEFDMNNMAEWMTSYEHFDDTILQSDTNDQWSKQYGTPDPTIRISRVPCGGCGALLHCSDPAIPGYIPSEIFKGREEDELRTIECQRCHFLKEYNVALDVTVQPEEYERLLQSLKKMKCMVVLMVDLLDFPCSIWPGIMDIIGKKKPVIIAANKVDLLPGDSFGYLKRIKECLMTEINKTPLAEANIKHVALISAKTGFGIESLITEMFRAWYARGDVYLAGCTNCGKSSLFNALLSSDYCKVHAVDLVRRATVSRWPGTTLNLLKFPINRPSGWKIYERTRRLETEERLLRAEKKLRRKQLQGKNEAGPMLIGRIGRTFSEPVVEEHGYIGHRDRPLVLDENDENFRSSKWLYDTPGVVHPDQGLALLTAEELLCALPRDVISPRTYYLREGTSLFVGGLARVDVVSSAEPCRLTVYAAEGLPVTVTKIEHAVEVYKELVGTIIFGVPLGGPERLARWPGLQCQEEPLKLVGEGSRMSCGDVVLSSAGWVSLTAKKDSEVVFQAWTPNARGIHLRCPALLPYSVNLKGKRVRDTPAYMAARVFTGDEGKVN